MANPSKETIYIDIDDEITAIIDKVKSSDKKIVALVLPKRATVLQSIVNMKLLKRTSDAAKKSLVLITSEASLLPLAGAVGVHVAKTLQSKPAIPAAPNTADKPITVDQDDIDDVELDATKPVGELADDEDEAIEVDNDDEPAAAAAPAAKKAKGKKKIKIPNFDKFRLKIVLGVLALMLLIIGWIFAFTVLPKATITVKTDANSIETELKLTVSPTATEISEDGGVVPGELKETSKTETVTVPATGELNKGKKASGEITLSVACSDVSDFPLTIPAGTGVSTSNLTFITTESISLTSPGGGGGCTFNGTGSVAAQAAGEQYNIGSGKSFTVAGYSAVSGKNSDAMSGGTNEIVKIVSQKDIDDARQKIQDQSDKARDELLKEMEDEDKVGLRETFATKGEPTVFTKPNANEEGANVTVTVATTYSLIGLSKDHLQQLIEKSVEGKYDKDKQTIIDNGMDNITAIVDEKRPNGDVVVTIRTAVLAGAQQDEDAIKQEVAGKKKSQTLSAIKARPGVTDAEVKYSPFWVSSTPKKTSKITVVFEQTSTKDASDNN